MYACVRKRKSKGKGGVIPRGSKINNAFIKGPLKSFCSRSSTCTRALELVETTIKTIRMEYVRSFAQCKHCSIKEFQHETILSILNW